MRNSLLSLRLFLIFIISVTLITSIVSAADPALHPNLSNTKNPVLPEAAINSPESPLSGQLMFSYENGTQAWTLQTASAGWRARLFPARVAAPNSKKAFLSTGGTKETRTGRNSTDPFAVIDEKLVPSEAAGLKSLIQNTLHAFSYNEATGDWYARNAANRITFTYTRDGTAKFSEGENAFGLTLLGIGRGDGVSPAGKGHVQADGRQLNITRPEYTEWYRNNDEGVEQGITIASRPTGSGLLHVGFGLTGNNSLSLKDKKTLILTDASGTPLFEYTGLRAFSSDGRDLPASLVTDGTTLFWVVNDTGAVYPVTIDPVVVSASKATAFFTGGRAEDYFGYSVALNSSGAVALIGAYQNDTAGSDAGAAYLFEKPEGGWSGTNSASAATATFTGGNAGDFFGYSVALNSSGAVALIGAYYNDTAGTDAGAAYLFEKPGGGWSGTTSANAANARFLGGYDGDRFGWSVALNSSGAVALVGTIWNATAGSDAGAAYLFEKPGGGWSETTSASAANARFLGGYDGEYFGYSVALNSSGAVALVGALYNATAGTNAGAAYLFEKPEGGWSETTSASAATATFTGGASGDEFGCSVALNSSGAVALVGAVINKTDDIDTGTAYLFEKPEGGWSGTTSASAATATFTGGASGDYFGYSVALSSSGTRALVGAIYNDTAGDNAGAAYLFKKPGGGWSGTTSASAANVTFTGGVSGDEFGYPTSLSSDGSLVLVGAHYNDTAGSDAGAAYIFPMTYLIAGGTTTGTTGTVVNGLTLNPTGTLTNVDLYLGTDAATPTGTRVKTGISLPDSVATTVDSVSLVGKTAGTYYIIACESGTTSILAATTSAVYTVTATPSIDGVIGFRWNTLDSSPRLYQIDSNGAVIPNGSAAWFNEHLPWSGMKTVVVNATNATPVLYGTNNRGDGLDLTGTYGDVMVEIPKFYTCSTYSNGNFSYWISPTAQDALHYTVAPMFNQRGIGTDAGTVAAYYYVGRYDANLVGSKLQSATGKTPNVDMTIGAARTYAENKGAGWGITNVWTLSALRQLFYTEMVTLDSQTAWTGSRGIVDTGGSTPSNSGADGIDAAIYTINATGNGTGLYGKTPVSYRGIENLWGNVWQFQDGFTATTTGTNVINATGLGLTGQATTFAIPLGVNDNQSVGALPTEGWQINLTNTDVVRPLFLPSQTSTSDYTNSYLSDYYYAPRSETAVTPNILQSGGYCDDAGKAGVGALAPSDIASYTYAVVGARLEFRRSLVPVVSFSSRNTSVATNSTSQGWAGVAPFSMVFNDTSTGTPISWVWSATNVTGNNVPFYINTTTVTLANISYEFKTAGNYTIKLNATNSLGSSISTQVTWVNVSAATGTPPVASFSSRNTSVATNSTSQGWAGVAPFSMVFNDTSTNTPTSWKWGRNNLTVATWEQFSTTNNAAQAFVTGNWSVNLTATNSGGSGISGITWVNVSAEPPIFSSAATNTAGTTITITFSKAMANPAGKHAQFNYTVNSGTDQSFSAATLNSDTTKIDLTTSGTAIAYGNTVTVNYTAGTVTAADFTILASFGPNTTTNNMPAPTAVPTASPAPTVTGITPATGVNTSTVSITNLAGTGFLTGATVKLTKTGQPDITATGVTVVSATQINCTIDLNGKIAGQWNIVVTNPDAQTGTLPNGFTITSVSTPAPTITGITPATGVNTSAVSITNLAGTGFLTGATVKLTKTGQPDITATGITVVSATQITCTIDLNGKTVGPWNVVVTNPDTQTGTLPNGFTINSVSTPAPTITGITPATGINTSTVSITNLAGTGFLTGATVKLAKTGQPDMAATGVMVVSTTQITCSVDLTGKTVGPWNVVVTNPDTQTGTLPNGFTVTSISTPAPTVTGITPATGQNTTSISITNLAGTGFLTGATVKLTKTGQPNIAATGVTVVSATQITCTIDLNGKTVGPWNVVVTNPDTHTGTLPNGFTITSVSTPAPTVTGITPATGINTSTVSITNLAGTGFLTGATVKLTKTGQPDIAATGVTVVSATQITCTIDLNGKTVGPWNIVVTNPDAQTGTLPNGFTVTFVSTPTPVADFTGSPTEGTAPLTITFTDHSTRSPTSWNWSFGDGSTSTQQNPAHTYSTTGIYTVRLTATNAAGSTTMTRSKYITVFSTAPEASFNGTPTEGTAPLTITFTDNSIRSPTSWNWLFGDGVTSTDKNPAHTYSAAGAYTVRLTATNAAGSTTMTRSSYITAFSSASEAYFTATPAFGTAPLPVTFTDGSTLSPTSWNWSFGDGSTSIEQNPSHTYSAIGTNTVSLTVTNAGGSDTITRTIGVYATLPVNATVANFTPTQTSFTNLTFVTNSTSSVNVMCWYWDFGDGTTSMEQNPVHTYSAPGTYTITLTTTNGESCSTPAIVNSNAASMVTSSTMTLKVTVYALAPQPDFTATPQLGNTPLPVLFTDRSTRFPTSWNWSFGDGGASTEQNPAHIYSAAGNYTVSLNVKNSVGNDTLTRTNYITVSTFSPQAYFTGTPVYGTAPLPVTFTDGSARSPTSWNWNFGDGTTSTAKNPSHTYSAPGTYTVSLNATNALGSDTITRSGYITVTNVPPAPTITRIMPSSGLNTGIVSITNLAGTGFYGTPTVNLIMTGQSSIPATGVTVVDSTKITCTFNLAGKTTGLWDVIVVNPDGQQGSLVEGFTIYDVPTPTPTPTPEGGSGGGDTILPAQPGQYGSGMAIANEAPAGQTVSYSFGTPTTQYPVSIQSVSFVPSTAITQSQCLVQQQGPATAYGLTDRPAAYESIEIGWINPALITSGKIHFSVLGSWMREKHIDPTNVVLLRSHDLVWTELPTAFDRMEGDNYYYTSDTPGFSYFAVSDRRTTPAAIATPQVTVSRSAEIQPASPSVTATAITTSVPTKTQTPVPATPAPEAGSGSPVVYYLAGVMIVVVLVAGGFLIRRWWIRRQNPTLFRELD